jgi:DNA-binding transcriptional LysR family regulator
MYIQLMSMIHEVAQVDLNLLVVLDVLLRSRSTTVAARRLGRTQSAVSHALARLRDTFEDPLFVRVGSALRPTQVAEALEVPLREVLLRAEALLSRSDGVLDPRRIERTFVVAGTDFAEMLLMPRVVPVLRRQAPGVMLVTRFLGDEVELALQNREIDLAFGRLRPLSGISLREVRTEGVVLLLRKGHPATRRPLSPRRYAALDHLLVAPRGLPGGAADTALEALGLKRRVVLRVPHFAAAAFIVSQTDLVVTVPRGFADILRRQLDVVALPLPFRLAPFTFSIGYSTTLENDPAHLWFRERVIEAARA